MLSGVTPRDRHGLRALKAACRTSFRESLLEPIGGILLQEDWLPVRACDSVQLGLTGEFSKDRGFFHNTFRSVSSSVSAAGAGLAGYGVGSLAHW